MSSAAPARRVVLVTGASRGLGASIARDLGARGHAVAVNGRPGGTDTTATVAAIRTSGGVAESFAADVFDPACADPLIADVEARLGRLDAIVLAATPSIRSRSFAETTDTEVRAYLDAYVAGPFAIVRAALPGMVERRSGRIVAVLTSAIAEVPPRKSAYIAAKAGLLGLCRALAVELGQYGISVNAVSPGAVAATDADDGTRAKESVAARTYPMRRLATHADVVEAVAFFLSEPAGYVSGANLAVTGGLPL